MFDLDKGQVLHELCCRMTDNFSVREDFSHLKAESKLCLYKCGVMGSEAGVAAPKALLTNPVKDQDAPEHNQYFTS